MVKATKKNCQQVLAASLRVVSAMTENPPLAEFDKVLVSFALPLNRAMLADGLWAIKITKLTAGAKKFREGLP